MKVDYVITLAIIAIYRNPKLSNELFLKGGSAMRLFDGLTSRQSIDADFSILGEVGDIAEYFDEIEVSLRTAFNEKGFDLIDFRSIRKPNVKRQDRPEWWGGWACGFKLVAHEHRGKSLNARRRYALIPAGSNSSIINLDISEHEYCGKRRTKIIQGVRILGYSREMIVLEKLRAICQQHPEYAYRLSKNRSRDFYDIHELTVDFDDDFVSRCRFHLKRVFDAKEVPLWILKELWNDSFIDEQRRGFDQVRDTVIGPVQDFDVYVEHVRFFVRDIYPEVRDTGN